MPEEAPRTLSPPPPTLSSGSHPRQAEVGVSGPPAGAQSHPVAGEVQAQRLLLRRELSSAVGAAGTCVPNSPWSSSAPGIPEALGHLRSSTC